VSARIWVWQLGIIGLSVYVLYTRSMLLLANENAQTVLYARRSKRFALTGEYGVMGKSKSITEPEIFFSSRTIGKFAPAEKTPAQ